MDKYFDWKSRGGRLTSEKMRLDGWSEGSLRPYTEGIYDVIYQDASRGKAHFDGTAFFTPQGDQHRVFAWKPSLTAPAHDMTGAVIPIGVDGFVAYESKTAEAEALLMMAEKALNNEGLHIEIIVSKVAPDATGAISAQRVLAMTEREYAVFDGSPEIKVIAQNQLDRPLEFGQAYTINFKDGIGLVHDGIHYNVKVLDAAAAHLPGGVASLTLDERQFIEKQILVRIQFLTANEIGLHDTSGQKTQLDLAISQAMSAAKENFHWTKDRPIASVIVEDEMAYAAYENAVAKMQSQQDTETESEHA